MLSNAYRKLPQSLAALNFVSPTTQLGKVGATISSFTEEKRNQSC